MVVACRRRLYRRKCSPDRPCVSCVMKVRQLRVGHARDWWEGFANDARERLSRCPRVPSAIYLPSEMPNPLPAAARRVGHW